MRVGDKRVLHEGLENGDGWKKERCTGTKMMGVGSHETELFKNVNEGDSRRVRSQRWVEEGKVD